MPSAAPQISVTRAPRLALRAKTVVLRSRIGAIVHAYRLDGMLAEGADPRASAQLEQRARRITRAPYRAKLAHSFETTVAAAEGRASRPMTAPPLASREVRASRAALLDLARALREDPAVYARGVALAERLLTDGAGPLYLQAETDGLRRAASEAMLALEGRETPMRP